MRNGECWERRTSELRISEIESGSPDGETFFHTPNTTGLDGGSNSRKALKKRVEKWPTPRASDHKGATSPDAMQKAAMRGFKPNLPESVAAASGGGQLNPTWVEWLMGWPLGWTDLRPLATGKSHSAPQPHGES
jgi:hypothetical protein